MSISYLGDEINYNNLLTKCAIYFAILLFFPLSFLLLITKDISLYNVIVKERKPVTHK